MHTWPKMVKANGFYFKTGKRLKAVLKITPLYQSLLSTHGKNRFVVFKNTPCTLKTNQVSHDLFIPVKYAQKIKDCDTYISFFFFLLYTKVPKVFYFPQLCAKTMQDVYLTVHSNFRRNLQLLSGSLATPLGMKSLEPRQQEYETAVQRKSTQAGCQIGFSMWDKVQRSVTRAVES